MLRSYRIDSVGPGHSTPDSVVEAIEHMFFVQYSPETLEGKLVIGDLNHLRIKKADPDL